LAERGEHLLGQLLRGQAPRQWAHYPEDDAIDRSSGYLWFYHSHSPEDRLAAAEHGHIHLFALRTLWAKRLQSRAERDFSELCGGPHAAPATRHLLAIGFDAKGLPVSFFTVNSWVTGDLMLSAPLTLQLLSTMTLDTGHGEVDAVLESTIHLCMPDIEELLSGRDQALERRAGDGKLEDNGLELLSELSIVGRLSE